MFRYLVCKLQVHKSVRTQLSSNVLSMRDIFQSQNQVISYVLCMGHVFESMGHILAATIEPLVHVRTSLQTFCLGGHKKIFIINQMLFNIATLIILQQIETQKQFSPRWGIFDHHTLPITYTYLTERSKVQDFKSTILQIFLSVCIFLTR